MLKITFKKQKKETKIVLTNQSPNLLQIIALIGHWLGMVYLPHPRGNFVDHIFLEAQCLARILKHVSPLTMAALSCNSLLHTLPYKIFDNQNSFQDFRKVQKIR